MRPLMRIIAGLMLAATAAALPSSPPTHVLDQTDLLEERVERVFAASLADFERRTEIQMVVAILAEIEHTVEDDATRIYEAWGLGTSEDDRGVLLLIWPTERRSRIEVGYGLEGELTDISSGRILRSMQDIPSEEPDHRIAYMLMQIAEIVAPGDPLAEGRFTDAVSYERPSGGGGGFGSLLLFFLLFAVMGGGRFGRNRWLAPLLIMSSMGGGRRGGFGGGGFSGGGGMSGGGGASGGW